MKEGLLNKKIGILGGGQLGKMLLEASSPWNLHLTFMDKDPNCPIANISKHFVLGDIMDYDAVLNFARACGILSIEIEHVNADALIQAENEGIFVHPSGSALKTIQDKGLQKLFYHENDIPTTAFQLCANRQEIIEGIEVGKIKLPFVQKSRKAGYDGKGVQIIRSKSEIDQIWDIPSVIEEYLEDMRELAIIGSRSASGELRFFPIVEMLFHPDAHLVEYLICPSKLDVSIEKEIIRIAKNTITGLEVVGNLAVELFLAKDGRIMVNEVAPRPHNSGHHTIDSNITSQFEQHLRAICNAPLGDTKSVAAAAMVNILGAANHTGPAKVVGMHEVLKIDGAKVHLYGKSITQPLRKMGHVNILAPTVEEAIEKAKRVKSSLQIISA